MRTCETCQSCSKVVCICRNCEHIYSTKSNDSECKCSLRKRKCPYGMTLEKWKEEIVRSELE